MFEKRLKIFIGFTILLLIACIGRLVQMQFFNRSAVERAISDLKEDWSQSSQFTTVRGRIHDRNNRVLAADEPHFYLHISYELSSILDERIRKAALSIPNPDDDETPEALQNRLDEANLVLDKCTAFSITRDEIDQRLGELNDRMWNLRSFVAWYRGEPDPNLIAEYGGRINSIPLPRALEDFKTHHPGEQERLRAVHDVDDLRELNASIPLMELHEDDDVFAAQVEFLGVSGVEILPEASRNYPYGPVACHIIGWVGPAKNPAYRELFEDEPLSSYLEDDLCGRDGAEYVCEAILRGKRGGVTYDIDDNLISRTPPQFGADVRLTLDIEMQKAVEELLVDPNANSFYYEDCAAVVLDVPTGDILVAASQPRFDLNRVLEDYREVYDYNNSSPQPWRSKVLNAVFPAGSVAKPLIAIAGLETGAITPSEIIPCAAEPAPRYWPDCWIWRQYRMGHTAWANNARNAIKGSCNIYFSRLADRIPPRVLQRRLYDFGYGREVLSSPMIVATPNDVRNFRQATGMIASSFADGPIRSFEDVPSLNAGERRRFGIGQGNLRVTPLQVANAMATIARGGVSKPPRLLLPQPGVLETQTSEAVDLHISAGTIDIVHDGMYAVVNESGGTAYNAFHGDWSNPSVKVYGKTGSTQDPNCAWFAGFAVDSAGREIAIAVIIPGGQSGSSDAAPLARELLKCCVRFRYVGADLN